MLKKTVKFTDYNGNECQEELYFNLNKAELMEMQLSTKGGLDKYLQKVVDDEDPQKIMAMFKQIILKAYGKKSEDGMRFIKSAELSNEFAQTEAYSELFMELVSDENAARDFMTGIVPNELRQNGANPIPQVTQK